MRIYSVFGCDCAEVHSTCYWPTKQTARAHAKSVLRDRIDEAKQIEDPHNRKRRVAELKSGSHGSLLEVYEYEIGPLTKESLIKVANQQAFAKETKVVWTNRKTQEESSSAKTSEV